MKCKWEQKRFEAGFSEASLWYYSHMFYLVIHLFFSSTNVVGRIIALTFLYILIPRTLHGKRDFADMTNAVDIVMRRLF